MSVNVFIGILAGLWLFSCAAAVAGLWFGLVAKGERFKTALALSLLALATGYVGISRFSFASSKTVNGHVEWSFNSKWFFLGAIILAALSLISTLWNYSRRRPDAHRLLQSDTTN